MRSSCMDEVQLVPNQRALAIWTHGACADMVVEHGYQNESDRRLFGAPNSAFDQESTVESDDRPA